MKVKAGYLLILFVCALVTLPAGSSFARTAEKTSDDPDKVVIDVSKIGEKLGVPEDTIPFVDGKTFKLQRWNKKHITQAIEELEYCFSEQAQNYGAVFEVKTDIGEQIIAPAAGFNISASPLETPPSGCVGPVS